MKIKFPPISANSGLFPTFKPIKDKVLITDLAMQLSLCAECSLCYALKLTAVGPFFIIAINENVNTY